MKLIKLFESQFPTSKEEVEAICKKYLISNYTINDDLSIDVDGHVVIVNGKLTQLPIKFRFVSGSFDCGYNKLISLQGAPRKVGRDFYCYGNRLASLEGAPREVGGDFVCDRNPNLKSLDGIGNVAGKIISDLK